MFKIKEQTWEFVYKHIQIMPFYLMPEILVKTIEYPRKEIVACLEHDYTCTLSSTG